MNLVKNIINKMPNDLTKLEQARFVYIMLGKILEFDTTTMYNSNYELFEKRKRKEIDITNLDTNLVNCFNWSNIYIKLLKSLDIKARIESEQHAWVVLEIDNEIIYTDATTGIVTDLARIKANIKTDNFYLLENKDNEFTASIDTEEFLKKIDNIDKKLGFDLERENVHKKLEELKREVNEIDNITDKIEYIFHHIKTANLGFFEGNSYIKYILDYCLELKYRSNIKAITLSKNELDGSVDSIKCITVEDRPKINYYIFSKNKGIYPIKKEKFSKLFQMGYSVESFKDIPGLKEVKHFVRYNFTKEETFKIKRENLYTKMYRSDEDLDFIPKQKSI